MKNPVFECNYSRFEIWSYETEVDGETRYFALVGSKDCGPRTNYAYSREEAVLFAMVNTDIEWLSMRV